MHRNQKAVSYLSDGFFTQILSNALNEPDFPKEIVDWYLQVFNDSSEGEWAESWTESQVWQKIFAYATDEKDRSSVTTWRVNGVLAGAAIVVVDRASQAFRLTDLPPDCQTVKRLEEVKHHLDWLVGDAAIAQYRELGIVRKYRAGLTPVARLIADSNAASIQLGAEYGCWWTNKTGRLFPIVVGLDCRLVYDFHDQAGSVLMIGSSPHMNRRLTWPPDQISAMLVARIRNLALDK